MPKYRVNRNTGWPFDQYAVPHYAFDEEFESDSPADARAAEQGYLILVGGVPPQPLEHSFEPADATPVVPFKKK